MAIERRYVLLLFIAGVASRGMIKSLFGTTASMLLLLTIAGYYLYMKRQSDSIYDDIARMQAQAAAKLDAARGIGDGTVSAERWTARKTSFQLDEAEQRIITDRMHQYSRKMSGSRAERKKFLRKRPKHVPLSELDGEEAAAPSSDSRTQLPEAQQRKKMERIVEDAVDATLLE
ncbi:hypothetical protein P43SY_002262 [Pythium insidiosum]|uniref:Transmembrane protein n=1 Tax=Pythium insidiosum TaxID=114742 RepID=A0AAD5LWJ5_PYTIN|nr:hypothetical protein P43SY_002262 [Pythium insidiosum]